LGLGVQDAERNEVVDVPEHLTGLGLAAGAGGEVGKTWVATVRRSPAPRPLFRSWMKGSLTTSAASSIKTLTGVRFTP